MVELGRRYDDGIGIMIDPAKAAALFQMAVSPSPPTAIYSPPVRKGGQGQMIFLPKRAVFVGLPEAQYRLGQLYLQGRGVPQNVERGRKLLTDAALQGHQQATTVLSLSK